MLIDNLAAEAVLELLPCLGHHVNAAGSQESKAEFIAVLRTFQCAVADDLFGPPVESHFYRCLANLAVVDPYVHWLQWDVGTIHFQDPEQSEKEAKSLSPVILETLAGSVPLWLNNRFLMRLYFNNYLIEHV